VGLESAIENLDISRDHYRSPQPQPQPRPQPQPQPQSRPRAQQPQASREPSSTSTSASTDQHRGHQAGSSGPQQHSRQLGGALKTSHEEVWYLKPIEFTSPSGVTRTYNVITQNYNGCDFHRFDFFLSPGALHALTYSTTGQAMFVHRDMQYPDPARTDRDTSPGSQERLIRVPLTTCRRTYSAHCARCGRICSAIDDASNY
jgi:hypothetical protein